MVLEQQARSRLATVRLRPRGTDAGGVIVDLLFSSSGIEPELAVAAERILLLGETSLPVARTGHLIALKVLARDDRNRPQDHDDLLALLPVASPADLDQARAALALIQARGYQRGKDLQRELDSLTTKQPK